METRKNLCAMLPVAIHARVRQEQEKAGMTLGEYVEALITEYYDWKDGKIMTGEMRTLVFKIQDQISFFQQTIPHWINNWSSETSVRIIICEL